MKNLQRRQSDNFELVKSVELMGEYGLPKIKRANSIPRNLIPFNMAKTERNAFEKWVHFFIHDYQFERIWNNPARYISLLSRFEGVITPDFSMYKEKPKAVRVWNCYRNRVMACWLQRNNIEIVPIIEWASFSDLDWCLEGLPKQSVIAIGTYGCNKSQMKKYSLLKGVEKICMELEPSTLICYGIKNEGVEKIHKNVIWFENYCKKFEKGL